jgi:hypothetical protein
MVPPVVGSATLLPTAFSGTSGLGSPEAGAAPAGVRAASLRPNQPWRSAATYRARSPPDSFAALSYQPPAEAAPVTTEAYLPRTGAHYHLEGCQYLYHSLIPISRENAQPQGYSPCSMLWVS